MASCNTRIVEAASQAFSTDAVRVPVGGNPRQVIGRDERRREVTVILDADETDPVYVVASPSAQQTSGIKLNPGAGLTLRTAAAVYVVSPTADATVYVLAESGEIG